MPILYALFCVLFSNNAVRASVIKYAATADTICSKFLKTVLINPWLEYIYPITQALGHMLVFSFYVACHTAAFVGSEVFRYIGPYAPGWMHR
jgi:hypothetical protein